MVAHSYCFGGTGIHIHIHTYTYVQNDDYAIAYVGLTSMLSGVLTLMVIGVVLDITKAF